MHILVGQDTDSESNPFGAAMPWIVKLDKEQDFIGKWALERYAERAARDRARRLHAGERPRADRGRRGHARRRRPDGPGHERALLAAARRVIGMAWVPAALAKDGARVTISDEGKRLEAEVVTAPFYDPDGEVLRS